MACNTHTEKTASIILSLQLIRAGLIAFSCVSEFIRHNARYQSHNGFSDMARAASSKRLEAYRQQQIELAKKIKEAEAATRKAAKEDAKRKHEIIGAVALIESEANPQSSFAIALRDLLNKSVTKPADRALCDLPPLPNAPEPPKPLAAMTAPANDGTSSVGGG